MPHYQSQEDEGFIRRNYGNNQNHARKIWRQNPVLPAEAQENRTRLLDRELQVSPSGRIRTNLVISQNLAGQTSGVLERRTATVANNEPRTRYPAANLNSSSAVHPSFVSGSPSEGCYAGALSVISGYQSCAAEALRYLVEEERLTPDDPLVIGLRQHLGAQQRRLDPELAFRNYVTAMAQRLMDEAEDSDECEDGSDAEDLSENTLRHLASAFLSEMYEEPCYNGSKAEPEVRWFEAGAPTTYEPMCEFSGAPSPTPSI